MNKEKTSLAVHLGKVLKEKEYIITTAESCTGGGVAQAITEIPGSSAWFDRGFVTYSNQAKVTMLHVKQKTLDGYGAVSEQVAIEMVEGALLNSNADLAVSVTGIAGPDGGTDQKPVGTVYIAWKLKDNESNYIRYSFSGDRSQVREQTVINALKCCIQAI